MNHYFVVIPSFVFLLTIQLQPSKLSSLITEYNCSSSRRCRDPYGKQLPYQSLDVAKKCEQDFLCQAYQYFESGNLFYGILCNTSDYLIELEYQGFSACIRPNKPRKTDEVHNQTPSIAFSNASQGKTKYSYLFSFLTMVLIHGFQASMLS